MSPPVVRVALFLAGYVAVLVGASVVKGMSSPQYAEVAWGTISSVALLALTWLFLRREQRTLADLAMRPDRFTLARLLQAMLAGGAVYPMTLWLVSTLITPLRLSAPMWPRDSRWLVVVASTLALACMEELGFRGYALRTLVTAIGRWKAQAVIAVAFGLTHVAYGWSWSTVALGVVPSGLLFGAVALRGGLARAIGVHAAVNLSQWALGAKETPGIWTLDADPAQTVQLANWAPILAAAVTLLAAGVVWLWPAETLRQD